MRSFRHLEVGAQLCVWRGVFGVWRPTFWELAFSGEKAFSGKGGPFGVFAVLGVFGDF